MLARTTQNKTAFMNAPSVHFLRRCARHEKNQFMRGVFRAMITQHNFGTHFKKRIDPEEGC